ncbi:MAG TPA: hypothetical protein PK493_17765, partial [Pseudomonadota bacterium]|nr:hypothetical protein [Pseudomonadota bacterium]
MLHFQTRHHFFNETIGAGAVFDRNFVVRQRFDDAGGFDRLECEGQMVDVAAEIRSPVAHGRQPMRLEVAHRLPDGEVEEAIDRLVEHLQSKRGGFDGRDQSQGPDGLESHARVRIGDARSQVFDRRRETRQPQREDSDRRGANVMVLRLQQVGQEFLVDDVEILEDPESFESVVFELRVARIELGDPLAER